MDLGFVWMWVRADDKLDSVGEYEEKLFGYPLLLHTYRHNFPPSGETPRLRKTRQRDPPHHPIRLISLLCDISLQGTPPKFFNHECCGVLLLLLQYQAGDISGETGHGSVGRRHIFVCDSDFVLDCYAILDNQI